MAGPAELDMQRFFSGALGIENGAVQASVSPTGGLRDPAIQGNIGGFYYPLAYINSLANSYPIPVVVDTVPARIGDTLQYRHNGTVGNGSVIETISLDRNSTVVTFELQGANVSVGDWDIWLWPAYYDPWLTVTGGGSDFRTTQTYREGVVTSDISVSETAATILGIPPAALSFGAVALRADEMFHGPVVIDRLREITAWTPPTEVVVGIRRTWAFDQARQHSHV